MGHLIYWTPICGEYFLHGSILEKCGKIWEKAVFSGRLRPDWGNTTRAAMAGYFFFFFFFFFWGGGGGGGAQILHNICGASAAAESTLYPKHHIMGKMEYAGQFWFVVV